MKVTKLVKEYIAEQVEAKIPMPETHYMTLKKQLMKAEREANKKLAEIREQMENEIYEKFNVPEDWRTSYSNNYFIEFECYNNQLARDNLAIETEVKEKRKKATHDIILELELGGDREILEELLAKL